MSKQEFEDDLDAVFGERGAEFAPKLRETLYQLWREGRKRGASHERDVAARQMQALPKTPVENAAMQMEDVYRTTKEWVEFDSLPKNHAIQAQAADEAIGHSETFRRILAGEEAVIKAPKGSIREKDYLGRDLDAFGQEFFGQILGVLDNKTKI